jgi:hypothetical protein
MIPLVLNKAAIQAEGVFRALCKSGRENAPLILKGVLEQGVHLRTDGNYVFGVPTPTFEVEQINARKQNIKCE